MTNQSRQSELKIVSIEWVETPDAKRRLAKVFEILLREPVPVEVLNGLTRPTPIRPVTDTHREKGGEKNADESELQNDGASPLR